MEDESFTLLMCVRCGFCCEKSHCGWGGWDEVNHRCTELIYNNDGTTTCGKYNEIKDQPTAEISPAFGGGCCCGLNSRRRALERRYLEELNMAEKYLKMDKKFRVLQLRHHGEPRIVEDFETEAEAVKFINERPADLLGKVTFTIQTIWESK